MHSSPGDVEHYRPKAGYRQAATGPLHGPGYYWLAYEWTNLLFACEDCNRIRKRQLFPLANDPVGRARTHYDDLTQEVPLLLNPATGPNPAVHLTFDAEVAIGLTAEGQASVAAYDLNRTALLAVRRDRLQSVRNTDTLARLLAANPPIVALEHLIELYGSVEILSWHIAEAQLARNRAALDAAEFAGMVRANFSHLSR